HVLNISLTNHRHTDWLLHKTPTRFTYNIPKIEPSPEIFLRNHLFQHRVPDMFGKNVRQIIKFLHLLVLGVASGKIDNRLPALPFVDIAEEQPVILTILDVGCE